MTTNFSKFNPGLANSFENVRVYSIEEFYDVIPFSSEEEKLYMYDTNKDLLGFISIKDLNDLEDHEDNISLTTEDGTSKVFELESICHVTRV